MYFSAISCTALIAQQVFHYLYWIQREQSNTFYQIFKKFVLEVVGI